MHYLLIVVAVLAAVFGFLTLSNATMGVGVICGACLVAVLARIAQAGAHVDELRFIRIELEKANAREAKKLAEGEPSVFAPK